jgi:carbonic anhydrase
VPFSWEPFGWTRRLAEESDRASPPASPPRPIARPAGEPAVTPQVRPAAPTGMPRAPARHLVVITCMDGRIDPLAILGLRLGDAAVLRNAGAMVSQDVLRSLKLSAATLGVQRAILLGHTNCAAHESDAATEVELRKGRKRIAASAMVPQHFVVEAMIYDVRTGALERLD